MELSPESTVITYASKEPPTAAPICGPPTTRRAPVYPLATEAAEAAEALFCKLASASIIESNLVSELPVPPDSTTYH